MAQESLKPKRQQSNSILRFSGMATQMAVIIALGVWGGMKLDAHWNAGGRGYTIAGALLGVSVAMYSVIKDLSKKSQ
jgi:ATP synthase protein I